MTTSIVPFNMYEALAAYQRLQARLPVDNLELAVMEIQTFMKMYPDVAMAHNDLGVMYYRIGNKLLALANYEKANRLQPGTVAFGKNLAEFYAVELGWLDDAIVMLTTLLKQYPDEVDLLAALSVVSEQIGRTEEARVFLRRVVELDPGNAAAREALQRLGQPTPVSSPRPLQPPPAQSSPPVPVRAAEGGDANLQSVLSRLRATVQATPAIPQPSPVPQPGPAALYEEARQAAAAGDDSRALQILESVVSLDASHALACNDLGVLYARQGDFDTSCRYHERAVAINPREATFQKNLADLYYSVLGKTDEAIAIYTRLAKEYPEDVEVLTALAIISKANNLFEQARVFIRKALDLEPWSREARDILADLG